MNISGSPMVIYESTMKGSLDHVLYDTLAEEIADNYRKRIGKPNEKELSSRRGYA